MKTSGFYSGLRVLRSLLGARFWAGTSLKRLQLFYLRVYFKLSCMWNPISLSVAESTSLALSLILSPISCGSWSSGDCFSRASIRNMQFQMREGAQAGNHSGHCHLQKSRVTEEPERGRMSQKPELTLLRLPRASWATEATTCSCHGAQRTMIAAHRPGFGKLSVLGNSLSDSSSVMLRDRSCI